MPVCFVTWHSRFLSVVLNSSFSVRAREVWGLRPCGGRIAERVTLALQLVVKLIGSVTARCFPALLPVSLCHSPLKARLSWSPEVPSKQQPPFQHTCTTTFRRRTVTV